jgi:hypothetical protein
MNVCTAAIGRHVVGGHSIRHHHHRCSLVLLLATMPMMRYSGELRTFQASQHGPQSVKSMHPKATCKPNLNHTIRRGPRTSDKRLRSVGRSSKDITASIKSFGPRPLLLAALLLCFPLSPGDCFSSTLRGNFFRFFPPHLRPSPQTVKAFDALFTIYER